MKFIFRHLVLPMTCMAAVFYPTCLYSDNNSLSSLNGSGTQEYPFLIEDAEDLYLLQLCIENHEEISKGKYFKLTNDIRLNDKVLNDDGSLVADTASLSKWTPIGRGATSSPYKAFQGNFDGNGHTIYGIYINDTASNNEQGLFGFIHRDGVVRNLCIADSYIHSSNVAGGICGECHDGLVSDCVSFATVESSGATLKAGGIAGTVSGSKGRLLRCTNGGRITGKSVPNEWGERYNCDTGGVCGSVSAGKVDSCSNEGFVLSDGWGAIGGVSGSVSGGAQVRWSIHRGYVSSTVESSIGGIVGNNWQTVTRCINEGEVVATVKGSSIGGIAGRCSFNSRIYDSENNADITSSIDSVFAGGIVGSMEGGNNYGTYYTPEIYRCTNNAAVKAIGASAQAGGISGKNYCADIHDCRNNGQVVSATLAGGISPLCEYHSNISGCANTGRVEGKSSTGGIVGNTNGSVTGSWNSGTVCNSNHKSNAGGIAGYTTSSVSRCFNTGEICNAVRSGGVVGNSSIKGYISSCYNSGYVHTENSNTIVAGVCGGTASVINSYNVGTVSADADECTAGGVIYNVWVSFDGHGNRSGNAVTNSYNMGQIIVCGSGCTAGNIAGSYRADDASMLFSNCYYLDGALAGEKVSTNDDINTHLSPLGIDDFKTLASKINVKDWWDENPYAFSQGYYRPVLNGNADDAAPLHYDVVTLTGDSVMVDLGEPADNTFFKADNPTDFMLDVYNFLSDNTVRRAMLVDGKDFAISKAFTARDLTYTRCLSQNHGSACLPFAVSTEDLPAGNLMLSPHQITDNAIVVTDTLTGVEAGQPFLFCSDDNTAEWKIRKHNVEVVAETVNPAWLNGTFKRKETWESGCYIPGDGQGKYTLAQSGDNLPAFRAYIQVQGLSAETLALGNYDDIPATGVRSVTERPMIMSDNRCIKIYSSSADSINVSSASGMQVYSGSPSASPTVVPVPADGLYIVSIGGKATKVHVR